MFNKKRYIVIRKSYQINLCRVSKFQRQNNLRYQLQLKSKQFVKVQVSIIRLNNRSKITNKVLKKIKKIVGYSSSYNLTPPISRILIGHHLIFCSLTSSSCCNSPRKYTPAKYKKRQKAGFPNFTQTTSQQHQNIFVERQKHFVTVRLQIGFLIFMRLTAKRDNFMLSYGWSILYTWLI